MSKEEREAKEYMEEAGWGRKCGGWFEELLHFVDQSGMLVLIRLLLG